MPLRRFLFVMVAVLSTAVTPALAQAPAQTVGIRILDAPTNRADDPRAHQYIVDHVPPGTTISRRVEVSNDTSKTQAVQLYPGAGSIKDGTFQFADGRTPNDLTTWTTVGPPTVNVAAGAKMPATVTIAVPANASPGERYGVVWAELPAAVPAGGGVSAVNRVGVRIYLSVGPGGEPASDFAVTTLEAKRDADGNPTVAAAVQNTGGRAVDLSGELRLTNGPGGLSAGPFEAKLGTTLGIGQTEPVLVVLDKAVPAGPWDGRIVLRSGLIEREATAKITFPAAPASSSGAVAPAPGSSGGGSLLPVLLGVGVLMGAVVLTIVLLRRRGRRPGVPAA
jgi:hypothetical protein